jgi:hypothetical protein
VEQPRRVRVPQVPGLHGHVDLGRFQRGLPCVLAEPVAGDVPVGVDGPRAARGVLAVRPPLAPVQRVRSPAVLAAAPAG